jgi:hypothetical protein
MRASRVFLLWAREVAGLPIAKRGNAPKGVRPEAVRKSQRDRAGPCGILSCDEPRKRVQLCLNHDIDQWGKKENIRERVSLNPVP